MRRVLLVEDLPQVAEHLKGLLARERDVEVIGVQPSPELAVTQAVADRPDVVLVDCPPGITLANEAVMRAVDVYLAPIVPTALGVRSRLDLINKSKGFLEAIWDPSLPEASLFVSAFGISTGDAASV